MSEYRIDMCPAHFRRRNGRLMRRGQIEKQRLIYVRTSRRPAFVHGIIHELLESQQRANEWMNVMVAHMQSTIISESELRRLL